MAEQALGSRLHTAVVPALRGSIVDSRGVVLAASIERYDITVNQQAVPQYVKTVQHGDTTTRETVGVAGAAADLAPLLGMTVPEVTDKLTGNRAVQLRRQGHHAADLAQDQGPRHQRHRRRGHLQAQLPDVDDGGVPGRLRRRRRPSRRRARAAAGQAAAGHARA